MFKRRKRGANERRRPNAATSAAHEEEFDDGIANAVRRRQQQRSEKSRTKKQASSEASASAYLTSSTGLYTKEALQRLRKDHARIDMELDEDEDVQPLLHGMATAEDSVGMTTVVPEQRHIEEAKRARRRTKMFIPLSETDNIGGKVFGRDHDSGSGIVREADEDEEPDLVEKEAMQQRMRMEVEEVALDGDADDVHLDRVDTRKDICVEEVNAMLEERICELREAGAKQIRDQNATKLNIEAIEADLRTLENQMAEADVKYVEFQRLQDSLSGILSCLTEKNPLVEEVMDDMIKMWEDREAALKDATVMHWKDEEEDAFGRRGDGREAAQDNSELDEFGRPLGHKEKAKSKMRLASRQRRKQTRTMYTEQDGWTTYGDTDVEVESEQERMHLIREANAVLDDVIDEFRSIDVVLNLFSDWRRRYPEAYANAFCSLSLPTVAAGFVRLELLSWHPLQNPMALANMHWKKQMDAFDDAEATQQLLHKVVLPFVLHAVRLLWNPFSLKETLACASLYEEFSALSIELSSFGTAVRDRLIAAMHWLQPFTAAPTALSEGSALDCCLRRWGQSLKLVHSTVVLREALTQPVAVKLSHRFIEERLAPLIKQLQSLPTSHALRHAHLDSLQKRLTTFSLSTP